VKDRRLYLSWLNTSCGDLQDWHGLPQDWTSEIGPVSFIGLDKYYEPEVVIRSCRHFAESVWADCMYNVTEAAL
jgi:hypothetical protein